MRAQDIMKLAASGYFEIFRINQISEDSYILKKMVGNDFPTWDVIAQGKLYDDIMDTYQQNKSEKLYPLLCSEKFTTFDLKEISKRGFRVLRETGNKEFMVEEFNPTTLGWDIAQSFDYIHERNAFINHQLMHPKIIAKNNYLMFLYHVY